MRYSYLCSIALLVIAATAPASATVTYTWPLTVNLPVNVKIGPTGPITNITVACNLTPQATGKSVIVPVQNPYRVPATGTGTPGQETWAYNGTMKLVIFAPPGGKAPVTGDVLTCKLNFEQPHGANWTYSGPVSLTLP